MCTHKHHVFFLETTTELSHSDPTRFCRKFISDWVPLFTYLKWYITLLTKSFVLFSNCLMAQKVFLWFFRSHGCIVTLKACSACLTAFPLWNLIVSKLNLWQAQNKSSNICSCSSLKCSKDINKNTIFTWWRHRKSYSNIIIYYEFIALVFLYIKGQLFG